MIKRLRRLTASVTERLRCWETGLQFTKFCLVGTFNTGVDFGIYLALTRLTDFWQQYLIGASAVAFSVAVLSSFLLNTFWTFRCGGVGWKRRVVPFFLVALGGLVINSLTVWLVVTLGVWDVIAKAVATVVTLCWNFTMQRKWTFRLK